MEDESRVRHKYYKGLREIFVSDSQEYVAWTTMELCFRDKANPFDPKMAKTLKGVVGLYGRVHECFRYVNPLSLGGDYRDDAKYGVSIQMGYIPDKKDREIIEEMLECFLAIQSAEDYYEKLLKDNTEIKLSEEEKKKAAAALIGDLQQLQPDLEAFLRAEREEGRYVYIEDRN